MRPWNNASVHSPAKGGGVLGAATFDTSRQTGLELRTLLPREVLTRYRTSLLMLQSLKFCNKCTCHDVVRRIHCHDPSTAMASPTNRAQQIQPQHIQPQPARFAHYFPSSPRLGLAPPFALVAFDHVGPTSPLRGRLALSTCRFEACLIR
jgi:hypothetical protein